MAVLEWTTGISDQTTVVIALDDMFFIISAIWGMAIIWQAPGVEKMMCKNLLANFACNCIQDAFQIAPNKTSGRLAQHFKKNPKTYINSLLLLLF